MSTVTTQAELDAALARGDARIEIRSPEGVWLQVRSSAETEVVLRGNSSAVLWGNSSAVLWGNSSADLRDNSSAVLWGNSSADLRGNSRADLREATSAHVYGRAHAKAAASVAVHLHSTTATVEGGVVIDVSKPLTDPADWCDYHGVAVSRAGVATVYKAVDNEWTTGRGTLYTPGTKPSAPDWQDDGSCGGGLHFGPTPRHAKEYHGSATRFVAVGVKVSELRPILDGGTAKCKAPRVVRACVEVDIDGNPVVAS